MDDLVVPNPAVIAHEQGVRELEMIEERQNHHRAVVVVGGG